MSLGLQECDKIQKVNQMVSTRKDARKWGWFISVFFSIFSIAFKKKSDLEIL